MNFLDLFAQKLREKREQKKITQRELAERLNICLLYTSDAADE